jgi:hypothetical protein
MGPQEVADFSVLPRDILGRLRVRPEAALLLLLMFLLYVVR